MEASSDYFIEFLKFKCSTGCFLSPAFPFFPIALSLVDEEGEKRAERWGCSRVGWHREQSISSPWGLQLLLLPTSTAPRQELERAFPGCTSQLSGWKCGSRSGCTLWGAVPQSLLRDELDPGAGRAAACPGADPIRNKSARAAAGRASSGWLFQPVLPDAVETSSCCAPAGQARQGQQSWEGTARTGREQKHQLVGRYQADAVAQSLQDSLVK